MPICGIETHKEVEIRFCHDSSHGQVDQQTFQPELPGEKAINNFQASLQNSGVDVSRCTWAKKMGCMVTLPEESHYRANVE